MVRFAGKRDASNCGIFYQDLGVLDKQKHVPYAGTAGFEADMPKTAYYVDDLGPSHDNNLWYCEDCVEILRSKGYMVGSPCGKKMTKLRGFVAIGRDTQELLAIHGTYTGLSGGYIKVGEEAMILKGDYTWTGTCKIQGAWWQICDDCLRRLGLIW